MGFMMMANRELRVIPRGWRHPPGVSLLSRERLADGTPDPAAYMPSVEGLAEADTEIAAYETTSEGSPISPAFPNTPEGKLELVRWCAENATVFADAKAGGEEWAAILFGDDASALVGLDGVVHISGEERP